MWVTERRLLAVFYVALGVVLAVAFALAVRSVYQDRDRGRAARPPSEVLPIMPTVVRYLEERAGGGARHTAQGWTWFCFAHYLGNTPVDERFDIYIWEGCQEYRPYRRGLAELTGWSVPAVITLSKRDGEYRVESDRQPGDGSYYGPDIKRMFPSSVERAISSRAGYSPRTRFSVLKKRARVELLGQG
jgi:hypothetical protein